MTAEKRGYDLNNLSGTIQADILKEYMAQKEYIFPPDPSVRIVRDCITHCASTMKRYNPINISGYHISEAGDSPLHEAAFTLANLIVYVEEVLKTGMDIDAFAPRLAFFFVCQADFFEEVAKFRALAAAMRSQRVSRMRGFRHWRWHLDEMYVKLNGEMIYLWLAVDHEGEILKSYIMKTRDKGQHSGS